MNMLTRGFLLALAVALAACATATPYQPLTKGEGYAERRIESNRYLVSFAGNSYTPRETVETYLLYRAAELTLANGGDYFSMVGQDTDADRRYTQTIGGFGGFGYYWWDPFYPSAAVATSYPITEYRAQANILVMKGSKPAGDVRAFDAREVKTNLEPSILRPEKKEQ